MEFKQQQQPNKKLNSPVNKFQMIIQKSIKFNLQVSLMKLVFKIMLYQITFFPQTLNHVQIHYKTMIIN